MNINNINDKMFLHELFRKLEANPECTQREISQEIDVSLSKVNYSVKKIIEKGLVKL